MPRTADHWSAAETYERFMGRWSRELAHYFVRWVGAGRQLNWLDVGCGTGALTAGICADAEPATVVGVDPSAAFVSRARSTSADPRASFVVASAEDFPLRPDGYDSIASLLALNFFPDPTRALERMKGALSPGGVVSACVWDYSSGMQFLRFFWDAARTVSHDADALDEAERFGICNPARLEALFASAGLSRVESGQLLTTTRFRSFEDYWTPLLGGTGPAPSFVAGLDPATRNQLRDELERNLPIASDGSIELEARAWAVRGYKD